jgi:hypothetical protein
MALLWLLLQLFRCCGYNCNCSEFFLLLMLVPLLLLLLLELNLLQGKSLRWSCCFGWAAIADCLGCPAAAAIAPEASRQTANATSLRNKKQQY